MPASLGIRTLGGGIRRLAAGSLPRRHHGTRCQGEHLEKGQAAIAPTTAEPDLRLHMRMVRDIRRVCRLVDIEELCDRLSLWGRVFETRRRGKIAACAVCSMAMAVEGRTCRSSEY